MFGQEFDDNSSVYFMGYRAAHSALSQSINITNNIYALFSIRLRAYWCLLMPCSALDQEHIGAYRCLAKDYGIRAQ